MVDIFQIRQDMDTELHVWEIIKEDRKKAQQT